MKVCIFCHDHKMSGANMSLYDWLRDSKDSVNEYCVVIPRYNKDIIKLYQAINVDVIVGNYMVINKKLYKTKFTDSIKNIIKLLYAILFNNFAYFILSYKLKKRKINIIHTNSFSTVSGVKVARIMKVPHVWHIREFMEEDHKITHFFKKKIQLFAEYSHAIYISDAIKAKFDKLYNFKSSDVIYNKIYYNEKYKKVRKFCEDDICNIIIVGTLQENKGQIEAIKAMEIINNKYSNFKLFICGDGPSKNYLTNYVDSKKIKNIIFLGHVKDVENIRKNIDINLMCSKNEALGRTTIEGFYYENLVIGAACGCTSYLVKNKINGLLYESGNYEELATCIINSIRNREESICYIKEAKKSAINNFSKSIINKIESVYEKSIKDR